MCRKNKKHVIKSHSLVRFYDQHSDDKHTYTIYDKSSVFSGLSGNLGMREFGDLLGMQRIDFFSDWPSCFAGDFCKQLLHVTNRNPFAGLHTAT